ncbi:hypothetical protein IFO69_15000 [Echinicola sp. CAU 1574]|uniref:Holin n=1 Tax=Echinicola arenosa TaxID=2774144 RepID=A0ABR9AMM8_9BACT|nr:hypothetical protein [Echinicola arenosa]MBD8490063.1 hypothetical protein [Echinicola arenosa]
MKNEIIKRLTSPTPPFFKRLRELGAALVATVITTWGLEIPFSPDGMQILEKVLLAGILLISISQLAIDGPPDGRSES